MATIGFIGLGNMGGPMAANLVKAGHTVQGFDLVPAALEAATAVGVQGVPSAAEAATGADVIITMLPNGKLVLGVYRDSVFAAAKPGALLIDSSTIDIESARTFHEEAAAKGFLPVDAPVSGGVGGAAGGTLTFMVGASTDAFALALPVLEKMGKRIVHCGDSGAGQAAKICNNMVLGISMLAVSEAFVLGEKLGLSHQALYDVASTSSGQCWSLTTYCPVPGPVPTSPANKDYQPGFATDLMLKDMLLSQAAAQTAGAITEAGALATAVYQRMKEAGLGGKDFSDVINFIRGTA